MIIKLILLIAFIQYLLWLFRKPSALVYCGLVGFSGKGEFNLDKIRTLLLWNSIKRGKDATGIFTPLTGTLKNNVAAVDFLSDDDVNKLRPDNLLIGHVRAGTMGVNVKANAHPFTYGEITLAHNGTLSNAPVLGTKYGLKYSDWDVDSQTLAHAISKNYDTSKKEEAPYKALGEYEGFAALLWYNQDTELLYAYHDANRPLFYGWDAVGGMYISSLKESLEKCDCFAVEEFEINKVYTIKDGQILSQTAYKTYEELNPKPVVKNQSQINFTRKSNTAVRAVDLVGFNVRAKYSCKSVGHIKGGAELAFVTANNWYLVTDVNPDNQLVVKIVDDRGKDTSIFLSGLDTDNCFPTVNGQVVLLKSIWTQKGDTKLWGKGDIATVVTVNFKKGHALLRHNEYNYFVDFNLMRVTTEEEEETPFVEIKEEVDSNVIQFVKDLEKLDKHKNVDGPIDSEVEPEDDIDDDLIPLDIYRDLRDELKTLMRELEEIYAVEGTDLTPTINAINFKLSNHLLNSLTV